MAVGIDQLPHEQWRSRYVHPKTNCNRCENRWLIFDEEFSLYANGVNLLSIEIMEEDCQHNDYRKIGV